MPPENQTKPDRIDTWVYLVVGLISLLLLAVGHMLQTDYPSWAIFLKELSFAGVIALILIGTIERFSRQRHERAANDLVRRINDNLFHAIYDRYVPHEVFHEVEKAVMRSNVFRRRHKINYTIENLPDGERIGGLPCDRHVKCIAQSSYVLVNVTDQTIQHTVKLNLERPIDPEWERHCRITSVKIDGADLPPEEIASKTATTPAQFSFSHEVTIKPKESLTVDTRAELIKRKLDQEIWTSRIPSEGIELTLVVPAKDLDIFANALHFESLVPILETEVVKSWTLPHGMFPFQSVVFWWRPQQALGCPRA